jgi:hypothetical protein
LRFEAVGASLYRYVSAPIAAMTSTDSESPIIDTHAHVYTLDMPRKSESLIEWKSVLDAAAITFGIISTVEESARDPQMIAAKALVPFRDGSALTVNSPFEIEGVAKIAPTKGPSVGQHNDEILRSLCETGVFTSPPSVKS